MVKRNSIIKVFITAVLVMLMSSIAVIGGCEPSNTRTEENAEAAGMLEITEQENGSGITLMRTMLTADDYAENGISPQADSAFTITATVYDTAGNAPASIQLVTYAMAWTTTSTEELSDYMTMTVAGTTATFTCLQAFTTQITVTCTSVLDTSKTATATIDYVKRLTGIDVRWRDNTLLTNSVSTTSISAFPRVQIAFAANWASGGEFYISGFKINSFKYGDGTVNATVEQVDINVKLHQEYKEALIELGEPWATVANSATEYNGSLPATNINGKIVEYNLFRYVLPGINFSNTTEGAGYRNATTGNACFFVKLTIETNVGTYYAGFSLQGT